MQLQQRRCESFGELEVWVLKDNALRHVSG